MWKRLGITALLLSVAVGCGHAAPAAQNKADVAPLWVDAACPEQGDISAPLGVETRGGIPDGFTATWLLRCRDEVRDVPGEGSWSVRVTERSDAPATELIDLLRRPSDPPPNDGVCPAIGYVVPYFLLVDANGQALLPAVPTGPCGEPRAEVKDFLDALDYRTLVETRLAQTQSQQATDTGCADDWKDGIAIGPPSPGPASPSGLAGTIRVCVYSGIEGEGTPIGHLETGYTVPDAPQGALDTAGPAAPCDKPHTRFAVLTPEGTNGPWAEIELDGCLRLLRPNNTLGQLDQGTIAALTG